MTIKMTFTTRFILFVLLQSIFIIKIYSQQNENRLKSLKLAKSFVDLDELYILNNKGIKNIGIIEKENFIPRKKTGILGTTSEWSDRKDTGKLAKEKIYYIDAANDIKFTKSFTVRYSKSKQKDLIKIFNDSIYYEPEFLKLKMASKTVDSIIYNNKLVVLDPCATREPIVKIDGMFIKSNGLLFHQRYWKINVDSTILVFLVSRSIDTTSRYDYVITLDGNGKKMRNFKRCSYISESISNELDSNISLFKESKTKTNITELDIYHIQKLPSRIRNVILRQKRRQYLISRNGDGKIEIIK